MRLYLLLDITKYLFKNNIKAFNKLKTQIMVVSNTIKFYSNYFFNICPENSWSPGYTTEKLYYAMISGCIPIYWGCDRLDDGFYNKEKIFYINKDLSNIDAVIDDAVKLLNSPNELINYVGMSPFGENRLDIISDQNKKIKNIFQKIIHS